jgi:murein DD-endopeptidase MepM/ murein hydrolase activator NlpD
MADLKNGKIRSNVPVTSKKRLLKYLSFIMLITVVLAVSALLFISHEASSQKGPIEQIAKAPEPEVLDVAVKESDTFYSLLANFGIPPVEIINMTREAKGYYDLRRITEGTSLKLTMIENQLKKVEYRYEDLKALLLERDELNGGFSASTIEVPYSIVPTGVSGIIESTLYESAIKAGIDSQVIIALSDIFAWDVDFATDIRSDDTFKVLYETLFVDGRPMRTGRVLGAELVNNGRKYTAIYYKGKNGRSGYFDVKGRSLNRQLLKSPLSYRRISSYFTNKRYHPILKRYRPHHGIDYVAPRGTPVESAGKGRVVYTGWKSGYGKVVMIKHNGTYSTTYGHLSRIARGIKRGAKVEQGQVVGYVGSTGLSTGAHLHYELKVNGRLVNPLSIKPLPSKSLKRDEMMEFKTVKNDIMARLSLIGNDIVQVANAGGEMGQLKKQ